MSKSTDRKLSSIAGVSRVAGLRANGTLTEGVSEVNEGLAQPSAGGAVVDGNTDAVAANKAAQNATVPAPINQPKGTVTGEEGKVGYDKSVDSVRVASSEVPQLVSNKANALPPIPQQPLPEGAPKTKGGLINAIYETLLTLDVKDLADVFSKGVAPLAHREPGVGLIGSEPQKQIGDVTSTVGPQFPGADAANSAAASKLSGKPSLATANAVPTSEPPTSSEGEKAPDVETEEDKAKRLAKVAEALNTLMSTEKNLSEGFKNGAAAIFESAVNERVQIHVSRIEENYGVQLAEETAKIEASLAEKVDSYLNYVVQNWMEENKVAIERGLRTEIAEEFIEGLKGLFKESYIEVPEGKENLVDELTAETSKLEEQLLKQTEANIKLHEDLAALQRGQVLGEASRGLAATEAAKLATLTEDVDFENAAAFAKKVATIRESFFHKNPTTKTETKPAVLTEAGSTTTVIDAATGEEAAGEEPSGAMALYAAAVTRTVKTDFTK